MAGKVIGYLLGYFIFTSILFGIITWQGGTWSYLQTMGLTAAISLIGYGLRMWLT
ncbi:MAG: hypothetical protein ACE5FT_05650 [Candidatus Nanoarchaeia archaeon]